MTIPLDKQYVPVMKANRTTTYKTAYFGTVYLGQPQTQAFTVVFDTGSGHLFVPSSTCQSRSCRTHRVYERDLSATAIDIDHDGNAIGPEDEDRDMVDIVYGTGDIEGHFVQEQVCIGPDTSRGSCAKARVILASRMSTEPFDSFQFDGVFGLGLEGLSLHPEFSVFGQMVKQNSDFLPHFGVFLAQDDGVPSEISFGGHDARRVAGDLRWAPVSRPELGYWMVKVHSVKVGGEPLEICEQGECNAIVDTGTSLLGVPRAAALHVHGLLSRRARSREAEVDCTDQPGPDLVFELGEARLTLGAKDYSRPAGLRVIRNNTNETQLVCRAQLLPVDDHPGLGSKTWILGEPVLRKYYALFDWERARIGFAPSVQPHATSPMPKHNVFGAPPKEPPTPTEVFI